jgi:hypothetical protein
MFKMSRLLIFSLVSVYLFLMVTVALPIDVPPNASHPISLELQEISHIPVNVTDWQLLITEINGRLDLTVDIYYSYNFTDDERLVSAAVYLSLDNMSFLEAQKHEFDPELMPAAGTGGFYFANSIGDPLPFDVYQGDILYGEVQFHTTRMIYRLPAFASEIPIDVIRPFLFRVPPSLFYIGGIAAGILPLVIIAYCVTRKRNQ